jgi:carbon monoxide dehydrogenase subunit G
MRLEHEFVVAGPPERAFRGLLDLDGIVKSLSDGGLEPCSRERLYAGPLVLEIDGWRMRCEATVRPLDVDEDAHVTHVHVQGREHAGPAIASGIIETRLAPGADSTRVALTADIRFAGQRVAQMVLDRRARALFDELSSRVEQHVSRTVPEGQVPEEPAVKPATEEPLATGPAGLLGVAVGTLVLLWWGWRSRRHRGFVSLSIHLRW